MSDDETAGSGNAGPDPAGGSDFGEEARRLAETVQQWARRTLPAPPSGHAGPDCQWCPLCQFASVLRGEHPELVERMTEAGTALASAVKALVESAGQHPPTSGPSSPSEPSTDDESPRVQRIRLSDPVDDKPPGEA